MGHGGSHANAGGQVAVAFALRGRDQGAQPEVHGDGESVGALRAAEGGSSRDYVAMAFHPTQDPINSVEVCHALNANANATAAVAIGIDTYNGDITGDVGATVATNSGSATASGPKLMQGMAVRRLTPIECEKLQGFSPNYTRVPVGAKFMADGPRYKMLGNSMATTVIAWIGARIQRAAGWQDAQDALTRQIREDEA